MVEILLFAAVALGAVSAVLGFLAFSAAKRAESAASSDDLGDLVEAAIRREIALMRQEADAKASTQRQELSQSLTSNAGAVNQQLSALTTSLDMRLTGFAELQQKIGTDLADGQHKRLTETNQGLNKLIETLQLQQKEGREAMAAELEKVRVTVGQNLETLRKHNEEKLEQMRATVDEKLQSTLNERLGESFKQVSDRLEAVHKGLGEMQTLASGVGDLKRVLTNVKTRGGWGEMQLGAILEDILAPEQYLENAQIDPTSSQRVEFALVMPGKGEGDQVLLPIDAKFPHEDYERLLNAHDVGDTDLIESAGKALERAVRAQAKIISTSYIKAPYSTEVAIMYLPTEGLYAEIARRPGLIRDIQNQYRVMVAGPSNLAAFLNSFQMGFRALAIQKHSSEVWKVLAAAKQEFGKYAGHWEKLGEQLDRARNTVNQASTRTRQLERSLSKVGTLEGHEEPKLELPTVPFSAED